MARKNKQNKGQNQQAKPTVKPQPPKPPISDDERKVILNEIKAHESKKNFWKNLFRHQNSFTLLINNGKHSIILNPKRKIRGVHIDERDEFCHIPVCGGANNLFDFDINGDRLIIDADVHTAFAVITVTIRT
jgi:hypothetical protein